MRCELCGAKIGQGELRCPECGKIYDEKNTEKTVQNTKSTVKTVHNSNKNSKASSKKKKTGKSKVRTILGLIVFVIILSCKLIRVFDLEDWVKETIENIGYKKNDFEWPNSDIAQMIPEPNELFGKLIYDYDEMMFVSLEGVTEEDYIVYVKKCKDNGFEIDLYDENNEFNANNADGYRLSVVYYNYINKMHIEIQEPIKLEAISWPENRFTELIPTIEVTTGQIVWDDDGECKFYVGNTTKEEFVQYVRQCINSGFNTGYFEDYYRVYTGENRDGYEIYLEYEGNNIMEIDLHYRDQL